MPGPELLEDEIGRKLREAEISGELRSAKGYGEPLVASEGWEQTPDELRMPFKILKDAGVVPPEVEMMRRRADLKARIEASDETAEKDRLKVELSALELSVSLRLDALRSTK